MPSSSNCIFNLFDFWSRKNIITIEDRTSRFTIVDGSFRNIRRHCSSIPSRSRETRAVVIQNYPGAISLRDTRRNPGPGTKLIIEEIKEDQFGWIILAWPGWPHVQRVNLPRYRSRIALYRVTRGESLEKKERKRERRGIERIKVDERSS